MGFTVYRPGGATDAEFRPYVRLLRQTGADLGKLLRHPGQLSQVSPRLPQQADVGSKLGIRGASWTIDREAHDDLPRGFLPGIPPEGAAARSGSNSTSTGPRALSAARVSYPTGSIQVAP